MILMEQSKCTHSLLPAVVEIVKQTSYGGKQTAPRLIAVDIQCSVHIVRTYARIHLVALLEQKRK